MAKYRKRPVVVEATQWFKNGDHPEDGKQMFTGREGKPFLGEGKIVHTYRSPVSVDQTPCQHCGKGLSLHGWVDTLEGGHIVCPGDWIITGIEGEHYPCKPSIFNATYEKVEE